MTYGVAAIEYKSTVLNKSEKKVKIKCWMKRRAESVADEQKEELHPTQSAHPLNWWATAGWADVSFNFHPPDTTEWTASVIWAGTRETLCFLQERLLYPSFS